MSMPLRLGSDDVVLRNVPVTAMFHQDNMRRDDRDPSNSASDAYSGKLSKWMQLWARSVIRPKCVYKTAIM
jgi:hypothetical protein